MGVPSAVGAELRDRRLELGLRQQDLADRIGMSRGYVSVVEGGVDWMPPVSVLTKWATALEWPTDRVLDLINRAEERPDLTAFIREQARLAVHEELAEELSEPDGPLARYIAGLVTTDLATAIADAVDELQRRRNTVVHDLTASALIFPERIIELEGASPPGAEPAPTPDAAGCVGLLPNVGLTGCSP